MEFRKQWLQVLTQDTIFIKEFNRIQSRIDLIQIEQWFVDPSPQHPLAHRGFGSVKHTQQRSFRLVVAQGLG